MGRYIPYHGKNRFLRRLHADISFHHFLKQGVAIWQHLSLSTRWVVILWFVGMSFYITHTPPALQCHDFDGHLHYVQIIATQKRLPHPDEGWELHQAPLYYLLTSQLAFGTPYHVLMARLVSMIYGGLFLGLMMWAVQPFRIRTLDQVLIALFIATTPKFLFFFSAYNNDVLVTLLSACAWACAMSMLRNGWNQKVMAGLVISLSAAFYTKYSSFVIYATLASMFGIALLLRRIPWRPFKKIVFGLFIPPLLLLPFLLVHYYGNPKSVNPLPNGSVLVSSLHIPYGYWRTLLTPPGFTDGEWIDPYVRQFDTVYSKKGSYLAYLFSSSLFGEYRFSNIAMSWAWIVVYLHLAAIGLTFWGVNRSAWSRWSAVSIALGVLLFSSYYWHIPYGPCMDYRYVAWLWIPGAVLYASAFDPLTNHQFLRPFHLRLILIAGLLIQAYLYKTLLTL